MSMQNHIGKEKSVAQTYAERVRSERDPVFWEKWAMHVLLLLGGVHLLAGVIFFFAYNWEALSAFAKFGLLQGAVVAAFVGAWIARLDQPAGQALLIAASVFTGVLLAVIGQVYQTGADAWQLFAAWVALILPWVMVSRSSVHVCLWIVLLLTATSLYGEQRLVALGHIDRQQLIAVVGMIPVMFLLMCELAENVGIKWLSAGWFKRLLVTMALLTLFTAAISFVFDTSSSALPGFIAFIVVAASLGFVYSQWLNDYAIVAITIAFATLFAMASGGRIIFEIFGVTIGIGSFVSPLLLLAGWCVLLTSITVKLLRGIQARMDKVAVDD